MKKKKQTKKDNILYAIEVIGVDKEKKCMKINFVGDGSEFDEWRDFDIDSDQLPFVRLEKNLCSRRRIVRRQKGNVSR